MDINSDEHADHVWSVGEILGADIQRPSEPPSREELLQALELLRRYCRKDPQVESCLWGLTARIKEGHEIETRHVGTKDDIKLLQTAKKGQHAPNFG